MNFSRLYMQSWWEVPSIAYFCSLFRTAFDLLDFDIEELEEALLTDGSEDTASSLLTELIVRLLNGCLGNNDISAFNYQMYLRRLFRRKCQETGRYNPFNTDIDFQFLPLRTKVEILYALCDFRLDAEDVFDLFKNLEAESLRVEPLGWDDNDSAYWYFYGTRLYREDILRKPKGKTKKKKNKDSRRRGWFYGHEAINDEETDRVWQVVCFTEEDWTHLTEKFSKATSKVEKELHRSLSQNFLPEIPRLFQEKERLQRKRLLELPRRTSNRVLQKIKQKEEETKPSAQDVKEEEERNEDTPELARDNRAKRRNLLRSKSVSSISSRSAKEEMPQKVSKRSKSQDKKSKKGTSSSRKGEALPEPPVKAGRKTNNSLASATGQILIPDNDEPISSTRKKLKTSQIFSQSDEDVQTDMYKVLEQLTAHDDAWPFMDPVEEEYAPNYYAVIRRPMDLHKMEKKLDSGYYTDFSMFKADFKLIVNNCRLYNGQDNEYTTMVDNLQAAFDRLTEKYIHRPSSSDEEIAVEFQIPTPSRKHKLKSSESQSHHKKKKRKSHSDTGEPNSSSSDLVQETNEESPPDVEVKKSKESHKNKEGKVKKKRKGHHRHGKHSKNHKKNSHKSGHGDSSKSKHSKKQKHAKNKDKSGKKSKKKKNKHREVEAKEVIKRSASQESIESSNRSRSASPLPSIHTPSPSPTELQRTDQLDQSEPDASNAEFIKDKYDKIKERRRTAAKDAWESLFDSKQKGIDKHKQNATGPEKDKNKNLTETIEKLKAKNEKFKDASLFNNLFAPANSSSEKTSDSNKRPANKEDSNENEDNLKSSPKKCQKKNSAKNESASEALEQAVKDISKWLDDAPKSSNVSSPCDSPAQTVSTEDHENSRLDDELGQNEKSVQARKEITRKRRSSREPKLLKRREIQRTIDRLQPGKSKGNLLTNITNKVDKAEEVVAVGPLNKTRDSNKGEESSPKLTLGSVLPTVQFTLGSDHNFGNNEDTKIDNQTAETKEPDDKKPQTEEQASTEKKIETALVQTNKRDAEVETEPTIITKPSQEKATPNLSAWFKAFGAPKSTPSTNTVKKKVEDTEQDEKPADTAPTDPKLTSPRNAAKYDNTQGPETPNPEGGESPLPSIVTTPRQRRTSTGSSMSERSSFSQDLDSPRHQMSHTSPLIQSPASPRTEDFQKITYPIINGTVRAGFYQDTTSMKSSPEKSCSPREAPQSPFSPYSQHVYASNSATGSTTPQYFVDQNKSPLPTYTQNPPPYYDTSKAQVANKPRVHVDYTALGPDSYPRSQYPGTFAPGYTALPQVSQVSALNCFQVQQPPQPPTNNPSTIFTNTAPVTTEPRASNLYPVKKRTYNEPDHDAAAPAKLPETKELTATAQNKSDYQKQTQPTQPMSSLPSNSVDDIALALSEKSELAKANNLRDKPAVEYIDRNIVENKEPVKFDNNEVIQDKKKEPTADISKAANNILKDNIDMVNMGYMNPDDRKTNGETHEEIAAPPRDVTKLALNNVPQKGYEMETTAINLGINNNQTYVKSNAKPTINSNNIPPAHVQERSHSDIGLNQIMAHSHHKQYDAIASGQTISNFSMNDIEQANKKLYGSNVAPSSVAIDFGNWKMSNQIRKQDVMASDYSTSYNSNHSEKAKSDAMTVSPNAVNYNKNVHQQQYNSYVPRNNTQRAQDFQQSLTSELRIPNPRALLKVCDHVNLCSSAMSTDLPSKNTDTLAKSQKQEKLIQNHPLVRSNPYKTPYNNHSSLIPQMLERYTNDERYSLAFTGSGSSIYHDKQFQMSQMFNKTMASDVHSPATPVSISYSQPNMSLNKDNTYKSTASVLPSDTKKANKRKRSESKSTVIGNQSYHNPSCGSDVLMPASAFNFGTSTNMTLGSGLYGDSAGFSIDANQIMAANYMVAAVAHQQRNNAEANGDKVAKPAHQNSAHASGTFPFIGRSQVPAGYSFVGTETSSPLYQQYLQRHQEELLRQTGAQIMSLYPSGYHTAPHAPHGPHAPHQHSAPHAAPPALGVRQPYESITRPSWL